jgi:hypothetical protein
MAIFATGIFNMSRTPDRPNRGTPEYEEWLKKQGEEFWEKVQKRGPVDFDESGIIAGDKKRIFASDAELFPDELEEHSPDERRKKIKPVDHKKN